MKKALIIVIAVIGGVSSIVFSFRNERAVTMSAAQPWPGQMGSLEAVRDRWPRLESNQASVTLISLANELEKNDDTLADFLAREITRGELTIGEAPALPDVSAIRELLLRERIVWESRTEFDDVQVGQRRTMQMTVARSLVASALTKARTNDPAAWEDLHAAWNLANSLNDHPQMMAQTAALTIARMINAVAWKMPTPPPAWVAELQQRDNVRPLLDAFQYQVANYAASGSSWFPTKWLASSVDHDRKIGEDLFNSSGCDVNTPMNDLGTDLSSVWQRAFRYRAEREATANALRVRERKSIETSSRCSDGRWMFDGTTLRFSRQIATGPPDTPMPLVLRVKP
jgi:hypothetical protein